MQSTAIDVLTYIQAAPADRQDCLTRLRQLCLETLVGYEEGMHYGMPGYVRDGVVEVGFASQKHYISLYILNKEVLDLHRATLSGAQVGKGCIRYTKPAKVDWQIVTQLLIGTRESSNPLC